MDALVLRVAARYAARPIPIDKGKIKAESDRLAAELAKYMSFFPADHVVGTNRQLHTSSVSVRSVQGSEIEVPVIFESLPKHSESLIVGASTVVEPHHLSVRIYLNGTKTFGAFTDGEDAGTTGLRYQIYMDLIHELTHVAESKFLPGTAERSDQDQAVYYNQPHEVRAYMQQIVDQVLQLAKSTILVSALKRKYRRSNEFVMALLEKSSWWQQIRRMLNPSNEAKILKAVYVALTDAGVLP